MIRYWGQPYEGSDDEANDIMRAEQRKQEMQRKMKPSPHRQRLLAHQARKAAEARKELAKIKDGKGKDRAAASKPKQRPGLGASDPVATEKKPRARSSKKGTAGASEKT